MPVRANGSPILIGSVVNAIRPTPTELAANGQSTRASLSPAGTDKTTTVGCRPSTKSDDARRVSALRPRWPGGGNPLRGCVDATWTKIPTGPSFTGPGFVGVNSTGNSEPVMAYGGRLTMAWMIRISSMPLRVTISLFAPRRVAPLYATPAQPAGAGTITAIVLDPNNWTTAFVTDNTNVYMTINAGASWTPITGNLSNEASLKNARLAVIPGNGVAALLFGGSNGVSRMLTSDPGRLDRVRRRACPTPP